MKTILLYAFFTAWTCIAVAQAADSTSGQMGEHPLLFVDSVQTDMSVIRKLDPSNIARIDVLNPKEASVVLGDRGKDGALYIITVPFAKKQYWNLFCTHSKKYRQVVPTPESDSTIQYILNGKPLSDKPASDLALLNDQVLEKLKVISKAKLARTYHVTGKAYGVEIKATQ